MPALSASFLFRNLGEISSGDLTRSLPLPPTCLGRTWLHSLSRSLSLSLSRNSHLPTRPTPSSLTYPRPYKLVNHSRITVANPNRRPLLLFSRKLLDRLFPVTPLHRPHPPIRELVSIKKILSHAQSPHPPTPYRIFTCHYHQYICQDGRHCFRSHAPKGAYQPRPYPSRGEERDQARRKAPRAYGHPFGS